MSPGFDALNFLQTHDFSLIGFIERNWIWVAILIYGLTKIVITIIKNRKKK